ncbi:MAG: hypothetical protein GC152_04465 [Alphaproteobacteria bacterium]|nr:hypothetical protein [Alphaproteobacteria bacterium]
MIVTPAMLDAVLGLVMLEAAALAFLLLRRNRNALLPPVLMFLAAGACLIYAVRIALGGQHSAHLAGALLGAFAFHAGFLVLLLRRSA